MEVQLEKKLVMSASNLLEDVTKQLQPVVDLDVQAKCDQLGGAVRKRTIHWKTGRRLKRGCQLDYLLNNIVQHMGDMGADVLVGSLKVLLSHDVEVKGTRIHPVGEEGTTNCVGSIAHRTCHTLLHFSSSDVLV